MKKNIILEFTLNGRKHTYFRRLDMFWKPLTTTNINSAKKLSKYDVAPTIRKLFKEYGKGNIKDFKEIEINDNKESDNI